MPRSCAERGATMPLPTAVTDVVDVASGQVHRDEPVSPGTGGPAGNAQLTARLGLALLVLFLGEVVTLVNVRGLITWHLVIGLLLIPPSLAKTATTGWRVVRYYTGAATYRKAGAPPLLLRLLGPLVVVGTLSMLGTGLVLVALGPGPGRAALLAVLGQQISALTLHQAAFVLWGAATGLHVLARIVPAVRLAAPSRRGGARLPGAVPRAGALLATGALAALVATVVLGLAAGWTDTDPGRTEQSGSISTR